MVQAERQRALKTAGVVTQADSERVELELRSAALALQKAQRDYDLTRVVAPFEGVVTGRSARVGRLVTQGDSLFHLTALGPVLASVRLPEASAFGVKVGTEAEVLGQRRERARAKVIRASPVIDPASGTREVVLQLVAGERMPPGSSVTVRIGSVLRQVVAVPREAIGEGYALVWEADRTSLRQVTVGGDLPGEQVEVVSGLAAGGEGGSDRPMNDRPRLRTDLVLVEQTYRGEQSFILKDPSTRKYFRFRPVEIAVMRALDGERTVAEAAAALVDEGVKVSAAALGKFAERLKTMGLCERTLRESSVLLMERLRAQRRRAPEHRSLQRGHPPAALVRR